MEEIASPSFHDYARAAHAAATRTRFLPLSSRNGFSPLAQTRLAEWSLPANVLVFHSLTKSHSLPGLRLGAVIGHPETISALRPRQEPWAVSRIAERAAELLSHAWAYESRSTRWLAEERGRLLPHLQTMRNLRFFPPTANFTLAQWRVTSDLDDVLNVIPAKVSIPILSLGTALCSYDTKNALRIALRDRNRHVSPNSGHPESCMAGALHVRRGGPTIYPHGTVEKPWLGDGDSEVTARHIDSCCRIVLVAGCVSSMLVIGSMA